MRDRPILFTGPMVRSILQGRKTQTRRIVKPQPECLQDVQALQSHVSTGEPLVVGRGCPYGQPGDRLWVKETWQAWRYCSMEYNEWCLCDCPPSEILEKFRFPKLEYAATTESVGPWRPSIYMPRWASRITLEIVSVRVERLHDISGKHAVCEGIERIEVGTRFECWKNYLFKTAHPKHGTAITDKEHRFGGYSSACASYASLWDSINGPGSWDTNPWVWVIRFERLKP